jgi:hypothetical protein
LIFGARVQVTGPVARSINWGKLTLERRLVLQVHYGTALIHSQMYSILLRYAALLSQARMNQQMQEESDQ